MEGIQKSIEKITMAETCALYVLKMITLNAESVIVSYKKRKGLKINIENGGNFFCNIKIMD